MRHFAPAFLIGAILLFAVVVAVAPGARPASAQTNAPAQGIASGGIGLPRAAWEAVYGGSPLQQLVEYPNVAAPAFTVLVGYEADRVAHLEFGFEEADAGGVSPRVAADAIRGALPADAEYVESFLVPPPSRNGIALHAAWWDSATLAEVTGGRSAILVLQQQQDLILIPGSPVETVVLRVSLTVSLVDQPDSPAPGDPGGIGLTRAEWEAVYGVGEGTQRGFVYPNVTFPVPGFDVLARYAFETDRIAALEFSYEGGSQLGGAAAASVQTQIAGALPADAVRSHTFFLPATPDGPIPLRIERWHSPSLAATGHSGAILVVAEERTAQQNPGSPPQTVVTAVTIAGAEPEA